MDSIRDSPAGPDEGVRFAGLHYQEGALQGPIVWILTCLKERECLGEVGYLSLPLGRCGVMAAHISSTQMVVLSDRLLLPLNTQGVEKYNVGHD